MGCEPFELDRQLLMDEMGDALFTLCGLIAYKVEGEEQCASATKHP